MADFLKIGQLIENLTGFIKVKIELLKLEILEEVSKGIANLFSLMVVMILGVFVLAFGSLTLGVFMNHLFESQYLGYLLITSFYLILFVVVIILTRSGKLVEWVEDLLVRKSKEIINKSGESHE